MIVAGYFFLFFASTDVKKLPLPVGPFTTQEACETFRNGLTIGAVTPCYELRLMKKETVV